VSSSYGAEAYLHRGMKRALDMLRRFCERHGPLLEVVRLSRSILVARKRAMTGGQLYCRKSVQWNHSSSEYPFAPISSKPRGTK